ncbi:MAG TPA: hypothetical protein DDY78_12370 [Planctomycetales bacterium]|jgi:hypothetical protein|nr:hypothetical protein [Planctomycetales bacterium]
MTLKSKLVLVLPLCLVVVYGCEKANPNAAASVTGKVTYKGQPVTGGMLMFNPKTEAGGVVSPASLNPDGTYSLTEAPSGDFTVTVDTESLNPDKKAQAYPGSGGKEMPSSIPANAPKATLPEGKYVKIPKKYSDPKESTLTAKLTSGKQTLNFELAD